MQQRPGPRRSGGTAATPRFQRIAVVGAGVVRFQEGTEAFDELAAQVLAIDRRDLSCMTLLLFGGPANIATLAIAMRRRASAVTESVGRLERAGYVRRRPGRGSPPVELTEHARAWITRIWDPLRQDGERLLSGYATKELDVIAAYVAQAVRIQQQHARRLRRWLTSPAATARQAHLRGGLSPAALKRVHLFVEANLERPLHLRDLAARAGLSVYHFARAFRTTSGVTPRAFIEARRVERAKHLIEGSTRSLADIAVAVGFGSQSRLTVAFRRQTGSTPARFRTATPRAAAPANG